MVFYFSRINSGYLLKYHLEWIRTRKNQLSTSKWVNKLRNRHTMRKSNKREQSYAARMNLKITVLSERIQALNVCFHFYEILIKASKSVVIKSRSVIFRGWKKGNEMDCKWYKPTVVGGFSSLLWWFVVTSHMHLSELIKLCAYIDS